MVKEYEAFLATKHAKQIVMIGDQKQLGPTVNFNVDGPTSLFTRLIQADYPRDFLDTQYRMHRSLMEVPNLLYYNNMIKCGYEPRDDKKFMYSNSPFLFVDVAYGHQRLRGTSFYNMEELDVIDELVEYSLEKFKES